MKDLLYDVIRQFAEESGITAIEIVCCRLASGGFTRTRCRCGLPGPRASWSPTFAITVSYEHRGPFSQVRPSTSSSSRTCSYTWATRTFPSWATA